MKLIDETSARMMARTLRRTIIGIAATALAVTAAINVADWLGWP